MLEVHVMILRCFGVIKDVPFDTLVRSTGENRNVS